MSNIILETSSDISKITTGQELNLVADEFYTYCIRMKLDINEAERMNYSLTALVPSFLKSHGFKPDFDSIFMTCDKTYVNTIVHHIKHNSLFNLEDRHVGNVLSNSLKLYIKFLSSEFDPRSNVYKKKNESLSLSIRTRL